MINIINTNILYQAFKTTLTNGDTIITVFADNSSATIDSYTIKNNVGTETCKRSNK